MSILDFLGFDWLLLLLGWLLQSSLRLLEFMRPLLWPQ